MAHTVGTLDNELSRSRPALTIPASKDQVKSAKSGQRGQNSLGWLPPRTACASCDGQVPANARPRHRGPGVPTGTLTRKTPQAFGRCPGCRARTAFLPILRFTALRTWYTIALNIPARLATAPPLHAKEANR